MATERWQPAASPGGHDRLSTGGPRAPAGMATRATGLARVPALVVGIAVLAFWVVDAFAWPVLAPYDPEAVEPGRTLEAPSSAHWFGTDDLGRDVLSRVLAGASSVLAVAVPAALLAVVVGVAVGLAAGYVGRATDEVVMRLVDVMLAFPLVVLAVLVLSSAGVAQTNLVVVIAIVLTPLTARTIRAATRSERGREYVEAARLRGDSAPSIMVAEILPNLSGLVIAEATVRFAAAIFAAATLSFLGLGIQQPSPDWGLSVALGRVFMQTAPWVVLFPALALATLVVAVTVVADTLRERIER